MRPTFWCGAAALGSLVYAILRTSTPSEPTTSLKYRSLAAGRKYAIAQNGPPGAPIVIALHGAGESVDDFRALGGYRLEQLACDYSFTLVYAVGVGRSFNDARTPLPYKARRKGINDVAYLRNIVTDLIQDTKSPVFGIGYSNGAHMLLRAVVEDPGLFAGVAISGAAFAIQSATPSEAFTLVQLAGTRDRLSPIKGGSPPLLGRLIGPTASVPATARTIAVAAGADLVEQTVIPDRCPIEVSRWQGPDHHVSLYLSHGAGHVFPVPNASRARLYGRAPSIDFPQVALRDLGIIPSGDE